MELEDEDCTQEKPPEEEVCTVDTPCGASDWIATEWSGCEETCGTYLCTMRVNQRKIDWVRFPR